MRWLRQWAVWAMVAAIVFALGGCNTLRGVGRDIKKSGEAIERVAS